MNYLFPQGFPLWKEKIIMDTADALYFIADATFYILILMRIYIPFNINKYIIYFLVLLISIYILFAIFYCISLVIFWTQPVYFAWIDAVLMCVDFMLNIIILIIFATKMRHTIFSIDVSELTIQAQKNVNLIENTVIKHCILFGIAMIINQGFYSIGFYMAFAHKWGVKQWKDLMYSIRALENLVNIIVLWLVLRINYNKYIRLCGPCHKCIGKCCFKNTHHVMDNPYFELKDAA